MVDLLAGQELTLDPAIPDDVAAVLRRALRRDRAARQPDAAAFAQELGITLARRIDRDPRTVLHTYLEQLRDAGPARPRGRFDDLVGIGLDMVPVGEHDGVRSFESRTTRAPLPVVGNSGPEGREDNSRRGRSLWLAIAAILVLGVVAFAWSTRPANIDPVVASHESPSSAPVDPGADRSPITRDSTADTERGRRARRSHRGDTRHFDGARTRRDGPRSSRQATHADARRRPTRRDRHRNPPHRRRESGPRGDPRRRQADGLRPQAARAAHGSARARVGRRYPGNSVATRHIELSARHTASSPLRWIVDS